LKAAFDIIRQFHSTQHTTRHKQIPGKPTTTPTNRNQQERI
jgi:hypothetical protein